MRFESSGFARLITIALAAFSVSACNEVMNGFVRSIGDDEVIGLADGAVDAVLARDDDAVRALTHPQAEHVFTAEAMAQVFEYLPAEPERRRHLLQYNWSTFQTLGHEPTRRVTLIYHVQFEPDQSGLTRSEFVRIGLLANGEAPLRLAEFRVFPVPEPIYGGIDDWPTGFWAALIIAPLTAIFCLLALISVWRTPRLKRRILWSLFVVLIGYPVFAFSTETGSWFLLSPGIHRTPTGVHYSFLDFTVFSASWVQQTFTGHHVFNVAIPVGALLFFLQKTRGKLAFKAPKSQSDRNAASPDQPSNPVSP